MSVEIRRCREEDLAEVAALYRAWQEEGSVWGLVSEPAERLRGRMGAFFLVGRLDGRIAGFAIGKVEREPFCIFPKGEPHLEIEDVYVAPDARSRGVGTALMNAMLSAGAAANVAGFHLYSASKHPADAQRFYERFGFRTWAFQMFRK